MLSPRFGNSIGSLVVTKISLLQGATGRRIPQLAREPAAPTFKVLLPTSPYQANLIWRRRIKRRQAAYSVASAGMKKVIEGQEAKVLTSMSTEGQMAQRGGDTRQKVELCMVTFRSMRSS